MSAHDNSDKQTKHRCKKDAHEVYRSNSDGERQGNQVQNRVQRAARLNEMVEREERKKQTPANPDEPAADQ